MAAVASYLGPTGIGQLATDLRRAYRGFPVRRFCRRASAGIGPLGLFARATHIARALDVVVDQPFSRLVKIAVDAAGAPLEKWQRASDASRGSGGGDPQRAAAAANV